LRDAIVQGGFSQDAAFESRAEFDKGQAAVFLD